MRERLQGRGRILIMSGGALLIAVMLGVSWGIADTTGLADVDSDASTTTTAALATGDTTTTTSADPNGDADPNQPDPGTTPSTTVPTGSGGSGGSGGTAPANGAPIIVDAGLSSNGLTLSITPTITDPGGDDVDVALTVNGEDMPATGGTVTTAFALSEVGYSHNATVEIRATDTAGNTTSEIFTHHMEAITTVTVRDLGFTVGSAACFAEDAAQRISATIILGGAVGEDVKVSEELRPDRSTVTLFDQASSEIVGEPPSQEIKVFAALDGRFDSYQQTHTESDEVLVTMFSTNSCEGFLTYEIEMITR